MPRYTAGVLSTAGSTTLPLAALVGGTATALHVREIGIFNTTTTAFNVKLGRLDGTTAGTPGASATTAKYAVDTVAATGVVKGTYSSTAPTTLTDMGYRAAIGAAVGAGVIWTFADVGIRIDNVTNAALAVVVESGSGQASEIYFVWDE